MHKQIIFVNCPKKALKGILLQAKGGLSKSSPFYSDGSWSSQMGG